jgi:hypothetical protein
MGLRDLADLPALFDQEGTDNFVDTDQLTPRTPLSRAAMPTARLLL